MPTLLREVLPFLDADGNIVAKLTIATEARSIHPPLRRISPEEARLYGEAEVQLLEGHTYQYVVDTPRFQLEQRSSLTTRFLLGEDEIDRGILSPGLKTGLIRLHLICEGHRCATASVEVRSVKLGYRDDYRTMLQDIANTSVDLLLQVASPSMVSLSHDNTASSSSLLQRLFFVKGLLEAPAFTQALQQLMQVPHSKLIGLRSQSNIGRTGRIDRSVNRQIASRYPRAALPQAHPLAAKLVPAAPDHATIPTDIEFLSYEDTQDTFENRFIKFALSSFAIFLADAEVELSRRGGSSLEMAIREVQPLRRKLDDVLSLEFFQQLSSLTALPLASPVLQRKAGYREIYQAWERFHVAARLTWHGGDDIYGGGKRDVAALYEYWLFFVLWDILKNWSPQGFALNADRILRTAADGFSVTLKQGELLETSGIPVSRNGRSFRVQFSYNRTFSVGEEAILEKRLKYQKSYPSPGSWTRSMRPDFTISIWPDGLLKTAAEIHEQIVHIHFDAKYSVAHIRELFGSGEEDHNSIKLQEREGTFKRGDLLKMHAYRDSIRRSQGAYILYPGIESEQEDAAHVGYHAWVGYQELLPGLGAFAVRPGVDKGKAVEQIGNFLEDVLDHVSERHSIRERIATETAILNATVANGS